jgi:hypothetical protein
VARAVGKAGFGRPPASKLVEVTHYITYTSLGANGTSSSVSLTQDTVLMACAVSPLPPDTAFLAPQTHQRQPSYIEQLRISGTVMSVIFSRYRYCEPCRLMITAILDNNGSAGTVPPATCQISTRFLIRTRRVRAALKTEVPRFQGPLPFSDGPRPRCVPIGNRVKSAPPIVLRRRYLQPLPSPNFRMLPAPKST